MGKAKPHSCHWNLSDKTRYLQNSAKKIKMAAANPIRESSLGTSSVLAKYVAV